MLTQRQAGMTSAITLKKQVLPPSDLRRVKCHFHMIWRPYSDTQEWIFQKCHPKIRLCSAERNGKTQKLHLRLYKDQSADEKLNFTTNLKKYILKRVRVKKKGFF